MPGALAKGHTELRTMAARRRVVADHPRLVERSRVRGHKRMAEHTHLAGYSPVADRKQVADHNQVADRNQVVDRNEVVDRRKVPMGLHQRLRRNQEKPLWRAVLPPWRSQLRGGA